MLKLLLPVVLALIGLGAGIGGGLMLRPPPEVVEIDPCGEASAAPEHGEVITDNTAFEYVKLNNQFVIPDMKDGKVISMVVLSLNLEATTGTREKIYAMEPKLRDAFLQVMFDHANLGGFQGAFTDSRKMTDLRHALVEVAQNLIGSQVNDVLVMDIVRQDLG